MLKHLIVVSLLIVSAAGEATECRFDDRADVGCTISVNSGTIQIQSAGLISAVGKAPVKLPLEEHFYIDRVTVEAAGALALVVAEITDSESAAGIIALVDPVQLRLKWTAQFPAFNISPPLVTEKAFYLAGIGTVAKYDATSGRVIWLTRGLYNGGSGAFNAFQRPIVEGHIVRFIEHKSPMAKYSGVREVRVDDASGRVVGK